MDAWLLEDACLCFRASSYGASFVGVDFPPTFSPLICSTSNNSAMVPLWQMSAFVRLVGEPATWALVEVASSLQWWPSPPKPYYSRRITGNSHEHQWVGVTIRYCPLWKHISLKFSIEWMAVFRNVKMLTMRRLWVSCEMMWCCVRSCLHVLSYVHQSLEVRTTLLLVVKHLYQSYLWNN